MHTPAARPAPPRTGRVSREQRASGAQPSTRAGKSLSHSGRPITDSVRSVCASIDRSVPFWRADPKPRVDARTLRRAPAREPRIRWSPGGRARGRARPHVRPPAGTCAIGNVWPPSARRKRNPRCPRARASHPLTQRACDAHIKRPGENSEIRPPRAWPARAAAGVGWALAQRVPPPEHAQPGGPRSSTSARTDAGFGPSIDTSSYRSNSTLPRAHHPSSLGRSVGRLWRSLAGMVWGGRALASQPARARRVAICPSAACSCMHAHEPRAAATPLPAVCAPPPNPHPLPPGSVGRSTNHTIPPYAAITTCIRRITWRSVGTGRIGWPASGCIYLGSQPAPRGAQSNPKPCWPAQRAALPPHRRGRARDGTGGGRARGEGWGGGPGRRAARVRRSDGGQGRDSAAQGATRPPGRAAAKTRARRHSPTRPPVPAPPSPPPTPHRARARGERPAPSGWLDGAMRGAVRGTPAATPVAARRAAATAAARRAPRTAPGERRRTARACQAPAGDAEGRRRVVITGMGVVSPVRDRGTGRADPSSSFALVRTYPRNSSQRAHVRLCPSVLSHVPSWDHEHVPTRALPPARAHTHPRSLMRSHARVFCACDRRWAIVWTSSTTAYARV